MASRIARGLRAVTAPGALRWWRPQTADALVELAAMEALAGEPSTGVRRDGSSADLRDRQRDLAFDMYAEALARLARDDADEQRPRRRASA